MYEERINNYEKAIKDSKENISKLEGIINDLNIKIGGL
jgi:prefoldin subunit 5